MKQKVLSYNIIFYPEPEGGFTVVVPRLPGCVTYGKNLKEAREMAIDAIKSYLASLKKHKEPIPEDKGSFFTSIEVRIPKKHSCYA